MRKSKLFFAFVLVLVCMSMRPAMADLLITPTRVVFNDGDRFALITLVNSGDETRTYEMGWRYYRMQEEGDAYQPTDKSVTEFDLPKHIMFTPRRVTLAPGAKQKIRLRLSRPETIPPGDYRGHFEMAALNPGYDPTKPDVSGRKGAAVAINVGYTIPVVLRVGQSDTKIDIGQVSFVRNPLNGRLDANVPLLRSGGAYGAMGHLYLIHIKDGKEEVVGEIGNAHIFPEVNRRLITVPLTKEISGGKMRAVLYNFDSNDRYIIAQNEFPLQ